MEKIKLSESEVAYFHTQGFVVRRNIFSPKEVFEVLQSSDILHQSAQELFDYIFAHEDDIKSGSTFSHKSNDTFTVDSIEIHKRPGSTLEDKVYNLYWHGTRFTIAKSQHGRLAIHKIVWAGAAEPRLLALARQDKLLVPISQLLRSTTADHLINQLHPKMPSDGVAFLWHQDIKIRRNFDPNWSDVNGTGSFVQAIMALDPMTKENGALKLAKGLPKSDLFLDKMTPEQLAICETEFARNAQYLELNPGDVVFMHPNHVHGSEPNTSNFSRRTFINGFASVGANHVAYPGVGSAQTIELLAL